MDNKIKFIKNYLSLLGLNEIPNPDINGVISLQKHQIETLSWNTIDVFLGKKINLCPQAILEKFLNEQPGGVCYELNGVFCYLLNQLGFDAYLASAYVHGYNDEIFNFKIDTHVVIILQLSDKSYLVDVGWGDFYRTPILIEDKFYFSDTSGEYRLSFNENNHKFQLEKYCNSTWYKQYDFKLSPIPLDSFYTNLKIVYTDPAHHTHRQIICIKPHVSGYYIIKQGEFISKINHTITKYMYNKDEIQILLKTKFGFSDAFLQQYFIK